ncbi:hypothetical protein BGAL_0528g00070 [Botrytis galanthina]|uniref:Uncharacterized protein n=1 Tax=Botrytis galanthina TaxID=278940 RepID=A0A4S8QUE6_9HELO|nr:hypothetical protein BGAL_0528g00070 [Botrytis galanthina]
MEHATPTPTRSQTTYQQSKYIEDPTGRIVELGTFQRAAEPQLSREHDEPSGTRKEDIYSCAILIRCLCPSTAGLSGRRGLAVSWRKALDCFKKYFDYSKTAQKGYKALQVIVERLFVPESSGNGLFFEFSLLSQLALCVDYFCLEDIPKDEHLPEENPLYLGRDTL